MTDPHPDDTSLDSLQHFFERSRTSLGRSWQPVIWVIALIIGIITAYAVMGFRLLIDGGHYIAFGASRDQLLSAALSLPWYHIAAMPVIGGLIVGVLLFIGHKTKTLPESRAHGVADVMEARGLYGGRVSLSNGLMSALVSGTSLGFGASAGREGPAVHLGASLASFIAQRLKYPPNVARTLLACGAAAAVSASFNAPIAGVLFALEVVLGHYALSAFAPIVIASAAAAIVTRMNLGEFPTFIVPVHDVGSYAQLPAFAILGLVSGLIAIAFIHSVRMTTNVATRLFETLTIPYWAQPTIGGVLIGLIAIFVPQVLGVGYETTDMALKNLFPLGILLILIITKIGATSITLACRFGGGVFSPAMFLGVMTGSLFGLIAGSLFPDHAASASFYAIIGMGAVSAAILGAPISTTLIAFELVRSYEVAVALMIAVSIASTLTQAVVGKSFFYWQIERRGHRLREGPHQEILQTLRVREFMCTDQLDPEVKKDIPALSMSDRLMTVFNLMEEYKEDYFIVADDTNTEHILGIVRRTDVLEAYNKALIEAHIERHR